MKNKFNTVITLLAIAFCVLLGSPKAVYAANPSAVALKPNKTYKGYDLTGDRKNDTIKISISKNDKDWYSRAAVMINGKKAYEISNTFFYPEIEAKIYTLKNGQPFLFFYLPAENGDGPVDGIFQYKSGGLKQVVDFRSLFKGYGSHLNGRVTNVSGNIIRTQYYVMSWALGPCNINVDYKYASGTLKRTSNYYSFDGIYSGGKKTTTFYANKGIKAYENATDTESTFTIKKGGRVVIRQTFSVGKRMWIKVMYNGRTGWIKAQAQYNGEAGKQFSNATYAG